MAQQGCRSGAVIQGERTRQRHSRCPSPKPQITMQQTTTPTHQRGLGQQCVQLLLGGLQAVQVSAVHHKHDGLHTAAIALPHAAEPRLQGRKVRCRAGGGRVSGGSSRGGRGEQMMQCSTANSGPETRRSLPATPATLPCAAVTALIMKAPAPAMTGKDAIKTTVSFHER